jgi:DHA2 family multidrug resistance protein
VGRHQRAAEKAPSIPISAFYTFLVCTPSLDRNFAVGMPFIFIVGITFLASVALLTPYL